MPARSRNKEGLPLLWLGCDAFAWAQLLGRNRFAVRPSRWLAAVLVTATSVLNTTLRLAQQVIYRGRVNRTPLRDSPVFILGHWRTGTTLLHELFACDPRHAAPTTYQCFAPHHFLISDPWLPRLLLRRAPDRRPMDNMAAGWYRPQEDEFALCLLGQPSPYERIAFPNRPEAGAGALDLRGLSRRALRSWERALSRLVRELAYAHRGRRLILKSPPHTCRIPTLLRLFPDARFVHIIRDPYEVYASTLKLWRVLCGTFGWQRPSWDGLPEYIFHTFAIMDQRLEEGRRLVPAGHFHELRYEDLVRDPPGQLEHTYRGLGLGDFGPARSPVEVYVAGLKGYEPNRHVLLPEEREAITRRWGAILERYGYPIRTTA